MYRNVSLHKVFVDTFRYICVEMYRNVSRCIEAYRRFSFFRFEITIICNSERSNCIQSIYCVSIFILIPADPYEDLPFFKALTIGPLAGLFLTSALLNVIIDWKNEACDLASINAGNTIVDQALKSFSSLSKFLTAAILIFLEQLCSWRKGSSLKADVNFRSMRPSESSSSVHSTFSTCIGIRLKKSMSATTSDLAVVG